MSKELALISQASKRSRKPGTRSRYGCPTCKIRRVKCDEARPFCKNCSSTGRQCEGFITTEVAELVPKAQVLVVPSLTILKPFSAQNSWVTEKESQYLNIFRHVLAPSIGGFHQTPRWVSLALQAMHEEPAVRHAVTALSAMQMPKQNETYLEDDPESFALQQYSKCMKAFQKLLRQTDRRSVEASLMCSILCSGFDLLQGTPGNARLHFEHGIRVISSINVDENLVKAFSRFDVQASSYICRRPPVLSMDVAPCADMEFLDLADAETSLYRELNHMWTFIRTYSDLAKTHIPDTIPAHELKNTQALQHRLERWKTAFALLKTTSGAIKTPRGAQLSKVLEIHYHTATVMIAGALNAEEMVYDNYDESFLCVVELSRQLIHDDQARPSIKSFSVEMGVVQPLWITATKCRVSDIRRDAIHLLATNHTIEGVWNGQIMAKIAAFVAQIEEEGLDDLVLKTFRVPESRRVHGIDTIIDLKCRRSIIHCRLRPNGIDTDWVDREDFVTW